MKSLITALKSQERNNMKKSMSLGGGGRFQKLKNELLNQGKNEEAAQAIAASIGRKKYGNAKMNSMARKGK